MWILIFWLSSPFNVSSGDAGTPHWPITVRNSVLKKPAGMPSLR